MVHAALRPVGIVNFEPVALRFYIVTDRLQRSGGLLGEQRSRGLVAVNAFTHKVIRAKIADFQNDVRHYIRHGHKVIPADGKALELLPGLGKIGYMANSSYTVIGESMSAGRMYDRIGKKAEAKVEIVTPRGVICRVGKKWVKK